MTGSQRRTDAAAIALAGLLVATSLMRVLVAFDRPLWLDEVSVGMTVSQPTLAAFARQLAGDVNGPLYAVLAALWAHAAGVSDHALRVPPAVFGAAAPLIALIPARLMGRATRFTWCALLACWIPGLWYSQEARPYTLALLLGVANAVTFAAVLQTPRGRAAWLWAVVSALLVLAHSFGALMVAIQGAMLIGVHRRAIVGAWPALAVFLPPLLALAAHAGALMAFINPHTTWVQVASLGSLVAYASFIFGLPLLVAATALWLIVAAVMWRRPGAAPADPGGQAEPGGRRWLVAAASLIATLIAVALAFLAPVLIDRYLTAFVPGLFLGLALVATGLARRWRLAALTLVAIYFAAAVQWAMKSHRLDNGLNWEAASSALMADHPRRLVFLWDTPMRPRPSYLAGLGGFFFQRAGRAVPVDGVSLAPGADPNTVLLSDAEPPGSAILWVYDLKVPGTAAIRHRPAITRRDPAWRCRDYGVGRFGILACDRPRAP